MLIPFLRKILFIHGFASSGAFKTADALRTLFEPCEVLAPDVPADPAEAWSLLSGICQTERPDLVVGLSWGCFWAQQLRPSLSNGLLPAPAMDTCEKILINPSFHTSALMRTMVGEVDYLSPRADGAKSFTLTEAMCDAYEALEARQYDGISADDIARTTGLFADNDERVRWAEEFSLHYPGRARSYHGRHLPTFQELKTALSLIEQ